MTVSEEKDLELDDKQVSVIEEVDQGEGQGAEGGGDTVQGASFSLSRSQLEEAVKNAKAGVALKQATTFLDVDQGRQIRDLEKLNSKYQMGLDQKLWQAKHNKFTAGFKPQINATSSTSGVVQKYVETAGTVGDMSPTRVARTPTSAKKIMNMKLDFDKYGDRARNQRRGMKSVVNPETGMSKSMAMDAAAADEYDTYELGASTRTARQTRSAMRQELDKFA